MRTPETSGGKPQGGRHGRRGPVAAQARWLREQQAREATDPTADPERLRELAAIAGLQTLIANNPAAPQDVLRALARGEDTGICASVAANPNTPVETLLLLADHYPRQFLDNPALPLLLIENPNLPGQLTSTAVYELMRFEDVPAGLIQQLTVFQTPEILDLIASHVQVAGEPATTPESLARMRHPLAETGAASRAIFRLPGFFTPWQLYMMARLGHAPVVACCPDTPIALLKKLAASKRAGLRAAVARNPATPRETLALLATDAIHQVRTGVAAHPQTPLVILERLANDAHVLVRRRVARNRRALPSTLERLAADPDAMVRQRAAEHRNVPLDALLSLARDRNMSVRAQLATNPRLSRPVFVELLHDADPPVRAAVAQNPRLPLAFLLELLDDLEDDVQTAARQGVIRQLAPAVEERWPFISQTYFWPGGRREDTQPPSVVSQRSTRGQRIEQHASELASLVFQLALREHRTEIARILARRRRTRGETLARLAQENDEQVYRALARHPNTPIRILWWLAQSEMESVWWALARNPTTPLDLLETLCGKLMLSQLHRLVTHPKLAPEKRTSFYQRFFEEGLTRLGLLPSAYRNEARNAMKFLRLAAFSSPALTSEHFAEGAQSSDWRERCVVAFNPAAPRELLEALAHDGHIAVRANAQATLAHHANRTGTASGETGN